MSHPYTNIVALPSLLLDAIKLHEDNLAILLKKYESTRTELVMMYMKGNFAQIRPDVLREFHYIDAYAKVLSQAAYAPDDKESWTAQDWIKRLFDEVYEWAKDQQDLLEYHLATQDFKDIKATRHEMYRSVLVAALMRDNFTDDQQRRLPAPDAGAGTES